MAAPEASPSLWLVKCTYLQKKKRKKEFKVRKAPQTNTNFEQRRDGGICAERMWLLFQLLVCSRHLLSREEKSQEETN